MKFDDPQITYIQELLKGELIETIGAILSESDKTRAALAAELEIPIMEIEGFLDGMPDLITFDRAGMIAAALGIKLRVVPVAIGKESPDWVKKCVALIGEEAGRAEGAEPMPERPDWLKQD